MPKRIKNEILESETESFYNIYLISFDNIKHPATLVEFGRLLDRLEKLESRARDIIEEFKLVGLNELSIYRRTSITHSELKLVLRENGKRKEMTFLDEGLEAFLETIDPKKKSVVKSFEPEVRLLNANLKIEWVRFIEFSKVANIEEKFVIAVKNFPKFLTRHQISSY